MLPDLQQVLLAQSANQMPPLEYLAQPYTAAHPATSRAYADAGAAAYAWLINHGHAVYWPIGPAKLFAPAAVQPPSGWYSYDIAILRRCDALLVLTLPGWEHSYGVNLEIMVAQSMERPVAYIEPSSVGVADYLIQACNEPG